MNIRIARHVVFYFFWFLLLICTPVQQPALDPDRAVTQYQVQVWNMESGLPGNSAFAIAQTHDGYLWVGTQGGLVRFDGLKFRTYSRANTPAIKDNEIRSLFVSQDNTLWIGTFSGGLSVLRKGKFFNYSIKTNPRLRDIYAINQDSRGNIWIAGFTSGLTCLDNGKFTTYTTADGLPTNQVRALFKDSKKQLWATTTGGIVHIVKPGVFNVLAPPAQLPHFKTTSLYNPKKEELWIGTGGRGLFRLKNKQLTKYNKKQGLPNPTVTSLLLDGKKNLWVGTDGGGLSRMEGARLSTLSSGEGLADGFVHSMFEDREGSLWVGTLDGGLHRFYDSKFITYTTREGLANDFTQCIVEGLNGELWIGTRNGLNRLDLKSGALTTELAADSGLLNPSVICLHQEQSGQLWIGTQGGLHRYKDGKITTYTTKDGLSDNRIYSIYRDRGGVLRVGTLNGLNRMNNKQSTLFSSLPGLSGHSVLFIREDGTGNLWVGSDRGLYTVNDSNITAYDTGGGHKKEAFYCLHEDRDGTLWFGGKNGLMRRNAGRAENYWFNMESGLIENNVYSIREDENGYLWLAGNNGITRVKKSRFEQIIQGKISRLQPQWFNEKDGMKARWCVGGSCKTSDKRLWFGTTAGLTMIDPNRLKTDSIAPPVLIEAITMDGETMDAKTFGTLKLKPGKKRITFQYTAVSFINPRSIPFKTKLEGYDSQWLHMGTDRSNTYTGLAPGHYTFKVMAGSPDGIWHQNEASISFYLPPHFYQTTWFYFLLIIAGVTAVISFHNYRVSQLKKRRNQLRDEVEIRTDQLKKRNLELETARQKIQHTMDLLEKKNRQLEEQSEKLKELDIAKSRFFANISHEFRTPLTLIKGPLEKILTSTSQSDSGWQEDAEMMLRNSNRLLNLVDQLLELAKFDSGRMRLEAFRQNIVPFVRSVTMCFESLAVQKKIKLLFLTEAEDIPVDFDPEKIERIFFNLLANAFNHTPAQGKIQVTVRFIIGSNYPEGCAEITVRDSGSGIPANQLPHIFQRFFRGEHSHKYQHKGTGIGLALSKELVELHNGTIEVQSSCQGENQGTEFIIRLPAVTRSFTTEHIHKETVAQTKLKEFAELVTEDQPTGIHTQSHPQVEPAARKKPEVLVVDDNADLRSYIRKSLEPEFHIKTAVNGKEGIQKALEFLPDLVISDIMMPEADGFELCDTLKKNIITSHIPIILLTAKAAEGNIVQGLETGADDYVIKPFNTRILRSRVKNLIRLRRQLQQKIEEDLVLRPAEIPVSSIDQKFMAELQEILDKNLGDSEFRVANLADKLYISHSALYRKIEALTGLSPQKFIRSYRLKRGAQLIKANFGNVTEISFEVGFSSAPYFTKCFKEKFKCSPSDYRG